MYRCSEYGYYASVEQRAAHYPSYEQPQPIFSPPLPTNDSKSPPSKLRRRKAPPHKSMVGRDGYPEPSPLPTEKSTFSAEDNAKLKALKERKDPLLSWKQIADFFPGRSYNTLQVHYCTKIKGASVTWTAELDERLRAAVRDDEAGKGKRVARAFRGSVSAEECEARMKVIRMNTAPQKALQYWVGQPISHDDTKNVVLVNTDERPKSYQNQGPTLDGLYPTKRRRVEPPDRTYSAREENNQSSAFWTIIGKQT